MEKVDLFRNSLFHDPPPYIFSNDFTAGEIEIVGDDQGRFYFSMPGNRDLPEGAAVASQSNVLFEDLQDAPFAVGRRDSDSLPLGSGPSIEIVDDIFASSANGHEFDVPGQQAQILVGGELAVEHQIPHRSPPPDSL